MKIKRELVKRNIAGDVILVPVGDASLELKGLIILNETGEFLWDALPQAENRQELVSRLTETYDVEPAEAEADTALFLKNLEDLGIL